MHNPSTPREHMRHMLRTTPRTTKGRFEMIVSVIGRPNSGPATKVLTLPISHQIRAESREPRAESREPRAESREPRAESREPRAESREPRAESRAERAESREPRAESREPRAESRREPRAEPLPRAESRPGCVMSRLSASGPHRSSLRRRLRPRENAATLLRGTRACLALLAALAVLALAVPEQAEAQTDTTFISNSAQLSAFDRSHSRHGVHHGKQQRGIWDK